MSLDLVFAALADPTRREILVRLLQGEATVSDMCDPGGLKQPTISKHLKVLEVAGLIASDQRAQRRPRRLQLANMQVLAAWMEPFQRQWNGRFDQLEALSRAQSQKEE